MYTSTDENKMELNNRYFSFYKLCFALKMLAEENPKCHVYRLSKMSHIAC